MAHLHQILTDTEIEIIKHRKYLHISIDKLIIDLSLKDISSIALIIIATEYPCGNIPKMNIIAKATKIILSRSYKKALKIL